MRRVETTAWPVLLAIVTGLGSPTAFAGDDEQVAHKYNTVEVVRFDTKEGVDFPPDFSVRLNEELVTELQKSKRFAEVLREGEAPKEEGAPALKLVGTVTEFKKGSQMKRYLIGFGAGKTKIVAAIKFVDRATGDVVYEDDVDGKVIMGFAGGESAGATHGLAAEVAKVAKKKLP
jgi:curli biogenesis system outer membrane secretion channel CsgG